MKGLLSLAECRSIAALYREDGPFRSRVVMGRHGFGRGEYKYFAYPLPKLIAGLRTALYAKLAPIANHWNGLMKIDTRYPDDHAAFLDRCHAAGQTRPTPLLLQYDADDFNLPAPGSLRRSRLSAAGRNPIDRTGSGSHGCASLF